MAATLLTIAAKAFDAAAADLTADTGGNSHAVGQNGADWAYCAHAVAWGQYVADPTDGLARKRTGGEQIQPVLYSGNGGADPLPVVGNDSGHLTVTAGALDVLDQDTALSHDGGIVATLSSSRLNAGFRWTFPVKRSLQTFWRMGWQYNGGWVASISISDASFATQTYSLPTGSNFAKINSWFEATWRGTGRQEEAGVTVTIACERTAIFNGQASAALSLHGQILRVPTPLQRQRPILGRVR